MWRAVLGRRAIHTKSGRLARERHIGTGVAGEHEALDHGWGTGAAAGLAKVLQEASAGVEAERRGG